MGFLIMMGTSEDLKKKFMKIEISFNNLPFGAWRFSIKKSKI
jgi:hypothetical protein